MASSRKHPMWDPAPGSIVSFLRPGWGLLDREYARVIEVTMGDAPMVVYSRVFAHPDTGVPMWSPKPTFITLTAWRRAISQGMNMLPSDWTPPPPPAYKVTIKVTPDQIATLATQVASLQGVLTPEQFEALAAAAKPFTI